MFVSEAESVVNIGVIENDMAMQMRFIIMDSENILIVALQKSVANLLSDLQGLFGCNFTGGEALDYVVCKDFGSPCALLSDCSEVGGSTSAVGSAGIRLHI